MSAHFQVWTTLHYQVSPIELKFGTHV
jgi:hypothetical protein